MRCPGECLRDISGRNRLWLVRAVARTTSTTLRSARLSSRVGAARPRTEDCAADPHHRGALRDRRSRSRRSSPSSTPRRPRSSVIRAHPGEDRPGITRRRVAPSSGPRRGSRASRHASTSAPCSLGRAPALLRLTGHIDLHEHRARPGARRPISAASSSRSTDSHSATCGATARTLLRCSRPMKCQRGAASSRRERLGLRGEILRAVLAEVDRAGGDRDPHVVEADLLRHDDERHRVGVAARCACAAARDRARAPRPAVSAIVTAAPRSSPGDRLGRRAGTRSIASSRRCTRRSRRTSATPARSSTTRIAAGMSSAGRPARVRPAHARTELRDERREVGRRRTRSARRGCTDRGTRGRRPSRCRAAARSSPRSLRPRARGGRRARRRPRRRTRGRAARSRR